jgi:2-aminomuconate deaminase
MEGKLVEGKAKPRGKFPYVKRGGDFLFVPGTSARRPDNRSPGQTWTSSTTRPRHPRPDPRGDREHPRHPAQPGYRLVDLVEVTTYLVNMNDFGGYNEVYGGVLRLHRTDTHDRRGPSASASALVDRDARHGLQATVTSESRRNLSGDSHGHW